MCQDLKINLHILSYIFYTICILSLLINFYLLWQLKNLNSLKKIFFTGKDNIDLENTLKILSENIHEAQTKLNIIEKVQNHNRQRQIVGLQKMGIIKFNPFSDSGGSFSFCLAILDEHDNGVVITSMYGREQNRIYSKILLNGKAESKLTEEESKAITEAQNKFDTYINKLTN